MSINPNALLLFAGITLASLSARDTLLSINGIGLHVHRRSEVAQIAANLDALWSAPVDTGFQITSVGDGATPVSFIRKSAGVTVSQGTKEARVDDTVLFVLIEKLRKIARQH
jgi:hypothetical protein